VRRRKVDLSRRVNGPLQLEFTAERLTSFAGLELLARYLQRIGFNRRLAQRLKGASLPTDFGIVAMVRVLLVLVILGGRRVRHIGFLEGDPLVHRFCGLQQLPTARTVGRWMTWFDARTVQRIADLNADLVAEQIAAMPLRTLTIDVDGTVVSTGLTAERAFRGYNPHHRKVPSYFPILAHLGDTGHILRVKNRSGNVHDGASSITFLREVFAQVDTTSGKGYQLNLRMDGAFFSQKVLRLLDAKSAGYAIKVPFWKWLPLREHIRQRKRWKSIAEGVDGFEKVLVIEQWGVTLRVAIYRKRVNHRTRKNYQLDLFDPDNGTYEYSAVATNLEYSIRDLWHFMCGRGAQEKAIAELKSGFSFDTVPTANYAANSVWQQISILAYNVMRNFQMETGANMRGRNRKRTPRPVVKTIQTLRFELLHRAGLLVRPAGRCILRISDNGKTKSLFENILQRLEAA
jgi:hypothetical protein